MEAHAIPFSTRLYTVKYGKRYIGFNNRDILPNAVILTFPERKYAEKIRLHLQEHKCWPAVGVSKQKQFVIHKHFVEPNFLTDDKNMTFHIDDHTPEEFVVSNGLNDVHTCVCMGMTETNTSFRLQGCLVCKLEEAPLESFVQNLDNIFNNVK